MRHRITAPHIWSNMGDYKVVEKFVSINGEATHAGELACFIRFAGCNLACGYCDTKWANEPQVPYESMRAEEIYAYIKSCGVKNVTLTGGEPLIQPEIEVLIALLAADKDLRVEIETNGSVDISGYDARPENVCMTLDYKLPDSGMERFMRTENYAWLKPQDAVKFVVSSTRDLETAKKIIETYDLCEKAAVYLSSAFSAITPAQIVDYMIQENMKDVRLQLQMHKYIWDPEKKGV